MLATILPLAKIFYQRSYNTSNLRYFLLNIKFHLCHICDLIPSESKVSRDVANLTGRKNLHTPVYGVIEFVCPSVTNFDPNYLRSGCTEWAKKFRTFMAKTRVSKFIHLLCFLTAYKSYVVLLVLAGTFNSINPNSYYCIFLHN